MNKLREEVLLKIEEMGLLLSKEVRDRVTEERTMRKQTLSDFDLKIRDFIKSVSANQTTATTKVSKRLTAVAKSVELTEKGWKQGIGSVANVVRAMQPALDNEISGRATSEKKMTEKLDASLTAIAQELESVTEKAFRRLDELTQKQDKECSENRDSHTALQARFDGFLIDGTKQMRADFDAKIADLRHHFEERVCEERTKRMELEREILLSNSKKEAEFDKHCLELKNRFDFFEEQIRKLEEKIDAEHELLHGRANTNDKKITETQAMITEKCDRLFKDVKDYLTERYPDNGQLKTVTDLLQQDVNDTQESLERTERSLSHRLEEESNLRRSDYKQMDTYMKKTLGTMGDDIRQISQDLLLLQELNKQVGDLNDASTVAKKQIRDLWTQLDSLRSDYNEFAQEQKLVMGFLDTQQKTKFSILQKDVSNLLTLYGTSSN